MAELPKGVRNEIQHAVYEALLASGIDGATFAADEAADAAIAVLLGVCEVREEWICTGEPGDGYPPYRFVWPAPGQSAEDGRRGAAAFVAQASRHGWVAGPVLHHRLVITTTAEDITTQVGDGDR